VQLLQRTQFRDMAFQRLAVLLLGLAEWLDDGRSVAQFELFAGMNSKVV
jgi:hypothetical protein